MCTSAVSDMYIFTFHLRLARHVQKNHLEETCMQHNRHDQNFEENVARVMNLIFAHYIAHN